MRSGTDGASLGFPDLTARPDGVVAAAAARPLRGPRLAWPDLCRAVCVLAVVLLHLRIWVHVGLPGAEATTTAGWDKVNETLAVVRMPGLLALSGMLASRGLLGGWREGTARLRAATGYYLYVVWLVVYFATFSALGPTGFEHSFTGPADFARQLLLPETCLWFLFALALYALVIAAVHAARVPGWAVVAAGAAIYLLGPTVEGTFAGKVAANFVFFAVGVYFAPRLRGLGEADRRVGLALVATFAVAFLARSAVDGSGTGVRLLHLALSLAAIPALMTCAVWGARLRPVAAVGTAIGQRTLPIYVLHPLLLAVLWAVVVRQREPIEALVSSRWGNALFVGGAFAVVVGASLVLDRTLRAIPGNPLLALPARLRRALTPVP